MTERNWAGTHTFAARAIHNPATIDEVQAIVAAAVSVRPLGTRHSFNDIADGVELLSLVDVAPEATSGFMPPYRWRYEARTDSHLIFRCTERVLAIDSRHAWTVPVRERPAEQPRSLGHDVRNGSQP